MSFNKSLSCLLVASLLWTSLPTAVFATVSQIKASGMQTSVPVAAWNQHFEANPHLFGALGISESLAPSLLSVMSRAVFTPAEIANLSPTEQAQAIRQSVRQQAAKAVGPDDDASNVPLTRSSLEERKRELSDLLVVASLAPNFQQDLIQSHDKVEGRIREVGVQQGEKTLSPLKNVRWEGGGINEDRDFIAGQAEQEAPRPSGLKKADPLASMEFETDGQHYKLGEDGLFQRQADGKWVKIISKDKVAQIEKETLSGIVDSLRDGKIKISVGKDSVMSGKKALRTLAGLVAGVGALGAASWAGWVYWAQLTAVVPPIAVVGFAGYVAYLYFRPKAKPQEKAEEPVQTLANLTVQSNGTSQSTILQADAVKPEEAAALEALQKALVRIAQAGLPMPIEKVSLVNHRTGDNVSSSYQVGYDPATHTLIISAQTLLRRLKKLHEDYPQAKDRISLEDVTIPVVFREVAKTGFSDGSRVDLTKLLVHQFTEAPIYLIGDLAIQEARKVLQPVSLKEKLAHWTKRLVVPMLSAAVIIPFFPGFAHALGQFNPGLDWQTGTLLSAKLAIYTALLSIVAVNGLIYAMHGTLDNEATIKDKGSKFESGMYAEIAKMNPLFLAPFLLLGAASEEQIFRWGLFGGLMWWFNLLPIGVVAAAITAAVVSSYIFASPKIHPGSTRPELLLGRFALGNAFAYVYYATSGLMWPSVAHGLHNYFSFLVPKYILGPLFVAYEKRKGLTKLMSLQAPTAPANTADAK